VNSKLLAATLVASCAVSAHAGTFLDSVINTLPGGIADSSSGFFSSNWDGMKKIVREGGTGLLLPTYTVHPAWDYDNRRQENGYTWGGGITRTYIDDRGNRRMMYAMAFSDSHNNFEPFVGYGWTARWKLGSTPVYAEAGYTLGITMRGDYSWIPIPAPLPLIGLSAGDVSFYGTYVPFSNIYFFFTHISVDGKGINMPAYAETRAKNPNLLYAGGVWQRTDMNGTESVTITSDAGFTLGYRRFLSENWAVNFAYTRSSHDLKNRDQRFGSYKLSSYTLAAQYHFPATQNLSLYAGVGGGLYRLDNLKLENGWSTKKNAVSLVIQSGATYAVTQSITLEGGLELGFPRFKSTHEGDSFSMRPSPATFKVSVGYAF
jgi:hypothetical protein